MRYSTFPITVYKHIIYIIYIYTEVYTYVIYEYMYTWETYNCTYEYSKVFLQETNFSNRVEK